MAFAEKLGGIAAAPVCMIILGHDRHPLNCTRQAHALQKRQD